MHQHRTRSDVKSGWPSTCDWNDTMDASQYPGYPSHYWYPQSHSSGHYTNSYPGGADVPSPYNPQVMPGGYPNDHGVYTPTQGQYSTAGFHPSNPFYCADPQRPAPYSNQGCGGEQGTGPSGGQHSQHHHPHYAGPHCQGASGYPPGPYPHYTERGHSLPPNPPYPSAQSVHPSPQAEAWAHSAPYPSSQQQQWPPSQNHYGIPVRPAHPPAWPGTGTGAPPPYQPKDPQHQRTPQVAPKPRPSPSPNPPSGKSDISSPPQMYNKPGRVDPGVPQEPPTPAPAQGPAPGPGPGPAQGPGPAGPQPLGHPPGLARVQQVMARVLLLQEDVDEFVGRRTDKSYRCLEELLTKELLELDSVETRGQDSVRHARKEAVQKIQAILDRLEKKAF